MTTGFRRSARTGPRCNTTARKVGVADSNEHSWLEGMEALGQLAAWQMMAAAAAGPVFPTSLRSHRPRHFVQWVTDGQAVAESLKAAGRMLELNPDGARWQVLAYDGYLDRSQVRLDAVMVLLHTYGDSPLQVKVAFPYRPADGTKGFAILRPTLLAANVSNEDIARLQPAVDRGIQSMKWPDGQSWDQFRQVAGDTRRIAAGKHYVASLPADTALAAIMQKLRTGLAAQQQRMSERRLAALAGRAPPWLKPEDSLYEVIRQQALLLGEGQIVWGALVQANSQLFAPGPSDLPAMLVYSPDRHFDARPAELRLIGSKVFALKGTQPEDPELLALARLITEEVDHSMGLRLPPVFSAQDIRSAVFMVFRDHLPNEILSGGTFPVLMHPSTPAVMIVPFEFWPAELTILWRDQKL